MTGNPPSPDVSSSLPPDRGQLRILLATESAVEQKLAVGLLTKHGHRVFVANNVREVASGWAENEFDLVIIDLWLAEMDGAELVKAIRHSDKQTSRPVPILVMTDDASGRERSLPDGMDGLIGKPLRMDQVKACLASALGGGQGTDRGSTADGSSRSDEVDWSVALESVGGRRDLLAELVEIFFTEYPLTLDAIRSAISRHDPKNLQLYAHKLKGCLRYFGEGEASNLAAKLEEMGRNAEIDGATQQYDELVLATNRLLPSLKAGLQN